ncbi:MAG TPA: dTDP-4-dehydrorhamnose reductase [Candidatus Angelobacter sp.]|nr:dTDP-4-dehydrorhamnose reductase [Candidatus Angelobacter sp.]
MKVAVIGATGQLGSDIAAAFAEAGHSVSSLGHQDVDIASAESVQSVLASMAPEIVVNTAAFHHVEKCEADPNTAFAVNALGARNVAQVTSSLGARVFHISTDYVFGGEKQTPYIETDRAVPVNVYGNTKLSGEHFVAATNPRHFILRVSALYGASPCRAKGGLNFVELMIKLSRERDELRVVDTEFVSPTPTVEIASQIVKLSRTSEYGLYHATSEGSCSWYEFARAIFDLIGAKVRLEKANPGEFPAKVARPRYSVLENAALKKKSLNTFSHWGEGLRRYLAQREERASSLPVETGVRPS